MAENGYGDFWDWALSRWWGWMLGALFFLGLAFVIYLYVTNLENQGQGGRINWIVALAYNIGGKWCAVSVLAVPGLIFALVGLVKLFSSSEE